MVVRYVEHTLLLLFTGACLVPSCIFVYLLDLICAGKGLSLPHLGIFGKETRVISTVSRSIK